MFETNSCICKLQWCCRCASQVLYQCISFVCMLSLIKVFYIQAILVDVILFDSKCGFLAIKEKDVRDGDQPRDLKPSDTFGKQYCPRPTLHVSQLIYKITHVWKFRLNRSPESGENNGKTHPCFRTLHRVMTCLLNKSVILAIENW